MHDAGAGEHSAAVVRRILLLLAFASAVPAHADPAQLELLRSYDQRLATISYRLTTANAALCRELMPNLGFALHGLGQYGDRAEAKRVFGFDAPVAVEAVVAGGPAARAGLAAGDSLIAVGGTALPSDAPPGSPSSGQRDAAVALIESQPPTSPVLLSVRRGAATRAVPVAAVPACRAAFELLLGEGENAQADGRTIHVSAAFFDRYSDEQVAVVLAHELSHNILRHRARLKAAGVADGLLKEFGRNARLTRQVEEEADLLSVHLLRNAGYDPAAAVAFWRDHAGGIADSLLRSRTHPGATARAQAIAAEIARLPAATSRPEVPSILARRDLPLD